MRGLRGRRARGEGAQAYAQARLPSTRTSWREARYCVVDLELSGLDPRRNEIVAFGALPIDGGRVRLDGAAAGLVRPTAPLTESAIRVHGIRAADLADAPLIAEALDPLLHAMAGRVLVAHHAAVERGFLRAALRGLANSRDGFCERVRLVARDGVLNQPDRDVRSGSHDGRNVHKNWWRRFGRVR